MTLFSVAFVGGTVRAGAYRYYDGAEKKSNGDFIYSLIENEVILLKAEDKDYTGKTFVFPAEIDGKKVIGAGYGLLDCLRSSGNADTITSIKVEEGVEKIAECDTDEEEEYEFDPGNFFVFAGLKNLKEVSLPSTLKRLDRGLFYNCESLKKIYVPDSVTESDRSVFENCTSLEEVRLSKNLTKISDSMFRNCTAIKKIKIPDGVTFISASAFENCKSLEGKFRLPKSLESMWNNPFLGCNKIDGFRIDKSNGRYTVKGGVLFSKNMEYLCCYPIGKKTKEYKLPSDVVYVADKAFFGAKYLEKVTLSDKTRSLGDSAFGNCKALKGKFGISKKLKYVGWHVFAGSAGMTGFKIDKKNKHFSQIDGVLMSKDKKIIYGCLPSAKIKEFKVPSTVKAVYDYAFAYTKKLEKVTFKKRCSLGNYLFANSNIKSVVFSDKNQNIGIGTFLNCKKLESANIPSETVYIKSNTFSGCKNLKSVKIPSGVYRIGSGAFRNCEKLKEIKLPSSLEIVGSEAFYGCDGIKSLTFPKKVDRIGKNAFADCKKLKTVRFNGANVEIEENDLKGSGIVIYAAQSRYYRDSAKQLAKDNGLKFVTVKYN